MRYEYLTLWKTWVIAALVISPLIGLVYLDVIKQRKIRRYLRKRDEREL